MKWSYIFYKYLPTSYSRNEDRRRKKSPKLGFLSFLLEFSWLWQPPLGQKNSKYCKVIRKICFTTYSYFRFHCIFLKCYEKITMIVKSTRRPINFGKFTLEWMLSPDPFCYFSLKLSFSTSPQTHYSTFAVSFFGSLSFASSFNWDVLLFIPLLSLEKNNHIYKYSQKFHLAPHIYLFRNREKILVDLWFHIDIRLQV